MGESRMVKGTNKWNIIAIIVGLLKNVNGFGEELTGQ